MVIGVRARLRRHVGYVICFLQNRQTQVLFIGLTRHDSLRWSDVKGLDNVRSAETFDVHVYTV
jgi:hypothetical protein